eukprot:TRINITY_DN11247_c0_g1_i2.p1 TRINITY_DN11247_c0_g1~~TRINITY_DN11247_c0_g1_i2.p1  ORF type:complete len:176 (-),score=28.00 TRINITY_DN11247_c0_g1_i2:15-542(-)
MNGRHLKKKERQQEEVVKPKQEADIVVLGKLYTIIDSQTGTECNFDFDIYYDGRKQIVIVAGLYIRPEKKEIVMTTINCKQLQQKDLTLKKLKDEADEIVLKQLRFLPNGSLLYFEEPKVVNACLLYTSDAADDMQCVDLGGRRIIQKKKYIFIQLNSHVIYSHLRKIPHLSQLR